MRIVLFGLILILFSTLPIFAQTVDTAWVRIDEGWHYFDTPYDLVVDSYGNVYVTGESADSLGGSLIKKPTI